MLEIVDVACLVTASYDDVVNVCIVVHCAPAGSGVGGDMRYMRRLKVLRDQPFTP